MVANPGLTYMSNLSRYGEVTMLFIEPSDRERTEKELQTIYRRQGLSFDARGGLDNDGKLRVNEISRAGSGWIANEPATTPGVKHIFIGDVRKVTGYAMRCRQSSSTVSPR